MSDDRLAFILRSPALVERVVRAVLHEALRSRRYQSGALEVRAFASAALSELERIAAATRLDTDAIGRLELQNSTVNAAGCFASSALARRLFAIPAERFRAVPAEVDAAVLDARERIHLIRLELVTSGAARSELARAIARLLPPPRSSTHLPQLHFLSLRDGQLRSIGEIETTAADAKRSA
ncbi:MAG: hypothetical protein IAI50_02705 [Candidatus Eremiobacteraeota bacterium]|nr:hypothetical protein [Candidatus Eremiobacteraeota bacterium]